MNKNSKSRTNLFSFSCVMEGNTNGKKKLLKWYQVIVQNIYVGVKYFLFGGE